MSELRLSTRAFGATGLHVTPLGLAQLFIPHTRSRGLELSADDVESAFYEHGINTFLVGSRMKVISEGVRRLIRSGHRDDLVLASGVGLPFAGSVRRGLERHLRLLDTDHIDMWLIGWVRKSWYVRESVWSTMQRLRAEGRVRAIGFSSHDRRLAARLARELPADFIMVRYNASHRGAEREVFAELADLGDRRPGIIAYTATRWAMLLKPLPEHGFSNPMSAPECYRFVLGQPLVDTVWCGAQNLLELREDIEGVLQGPIPPERLNEIRRFGDAVHVAARRGRRWMFGASSK